MENENKKRTKPTPQEIKAVKTEADKRNSPQLEVNKEDKETNWEEFNKLTNSNFNKLLGCGG